MRTLAVGWWLAVWAGLMVVPALAAAAITQADAVALATALAKASGPGGHAALASQADQLAAIPPEAIVPCLDAFRDATPAGGNWLRSGLDRAVDRLGAAVSADALAAVVADVRRPTRARSLAHAWLKRLDPSRATTVLDGLLDDPALDLRREAVDKLLASAAGVEEAAARDIHRRGLTAARDVDQIERIAGWLAERGEKVDVAEVLGFVRRWRVSEAFDNVGGVGFAKEYPPEAQAAAPDASAWKAVASSDKHGAVDLNAAIATRKGVLAYAVAEVEMPRAGAAEVRIGSPCAVAVWVNGRPVMAHEIYHASEAIDQYIAATEFRAGTNTVLVKCCQNEQTEPWAADWKFQLRITDPLGAPLATQGEGEGR
jgi:hypothetical protein